MFSRPAAIVLPVVLVALVATLGLALALPAWLGPDEGPHLQYAGWIATHHRLPDPSVDDVFQSQHPPAYHALLGLIRPTLSRLAAALPDAWRTPGAVPLPAHVDLEADRRVPDPGALPSLSPAVLRKVDLSKIPGADGFELRVWRGFGLVFLLATCFFLFGAASSTTGLDRVLGASAAAVAVLSPAFTAAFATPNNDQWAALFAAAGMWCAVRARGRSTAEWTCGAVLALGTLGKLTVIGAAAAAATWAIHDHQGLRARAAAAARVALPAFAVALVWMLRQSVLGAGPDGVGAASGLHAAILRDQSPDGLGILETVGRWLTSWIGETGGDGIGPGTFAVAVGVAVPVVCAGGSTWIALRGPDGPARRACLSFIAGAVMLGTALTVGNRHYFWTNGRYFIVLAAPATLAFAHVLDTFLGARARTAAALSTGIMAVACGLLLFGHVVPTYHPPRGRVEAAHLAAYVDAGSHLGRAATVKGVARTYPDSGFPGPRSNAVFDPTEAIVRVTGLPKDRPLLARVVPAVEPRPDIGVVDLLIDGWQVSGAFSPEVVRDGIDVPVPVWASADGEITVSARSKVGAGAGIAEISVFTVALTVAETRRDGNDLLVLLGDSSDGLSLPISVTLTKNDKAFPAKTLAESARSATLRFEGAADADTLRVEPTGLRLCDFKVARFATQDAEIRGDVRSLGFDVVRPVGTSVAATTLMPLFGSLFPEGTWALSIVDALETPIPPKLVDLVTADGRRIPAEGATIRVDAAAQSGRCGDLVSAGSSRIGIDRLIVRGARPWTWPVAPR